MLTHGFMIITINFSFKKKVLHNIIVERRSEFRNCLRTENIKANVKCKKFKTKNININFKKIEIRT